MMMHSETPIILSSLKYENMKIQNYKMKFETIKEESVRIKNLLSERKNENITEKLQTEESLT